MRGEKPDPDAGTDAGSRGGRDGGPRRRPKHVRRGKSQGHGGSGAPVHRRRPAEIAAEGTEGADSRPRLLPACRRLRGILVGGVRAQGPAASSSAGAGSGPRRTPPTGRRRSTSWPASSAEAPIPRRRSPAAASDGSSRSKAMPGSNWTMTRSRRTPAGTD